MYVINFIFYLMLDAWFVNDNVVSPFDTQLYSFIRNVIFYVMAQPVHSNTIF